MHISKTYNQFLTNRLRHHYGEDKFETARLRHSVLSLQFGLLATLAFGVLSWLFLPRPLFNVAGEIIAIVGSGLIIIAIACILCGRASVSRHIIMAVSTIIILAGIYISGGFPYSIAVYFTIMLPIVALRTYGPRVGVFAALVFPLIGIFLWYLEHHLGLLPTIRDTQDASAMAYFSIWLIGYFLIVGHFFVTDRENRTLQTMLDAERDKFAALATTDNLTQLCNSRKFTDEMDAILARSAETSEQFHLVYLDLNDFKAVNDTHGHEAGDEVLRIAAQRLQQCVREVDVSARLGGDEFALILKDGLSMAEIRDVLSRIEQKIAEPISYQTHRLHVSTSIGLACFPIDGVTRRDLMSVADARMYTDKASKGDDAPACARDKEVLSGFAGRA